MMNDTWYYYKPFKKDMGGGVVVSFPKIKIKQKNMPLQDNVKEWVGWLSFVKKVLVNW